MEDNTSNGILTNLSADEMHELEAAQTNFNDVFQNGGNANNFSIGGPQISDALVSKIVQLYINKVTTDVMTHLAESMVDVLQPPDIVGEAINLSKEYLVGSSTILGELLKSREQMMQDMLQQQEDEMVSKINNFANEKIGELTDSIKEKIDIEKLAKEVQSITKYASQGIGWLNSNLNRLADTTINSCNKLIDDGVKSINDQKDNLVSNAIELIAKKQANKTNEQIKKQLRKNLMDKSKVVKEQMLKVKEQVAIAKSKVMALLGV